MNNEEIMKYIADERARGVRDEDIKKELLAKGWKEEDVNGVLSSPTSVQPNNIYVGGMFTGRLDKSHYLKITLAGIFVYVAFVAICVFSLFAMGNAMGIVIAMGVALVAFIGLIVFGVRHLGATVRRLHDVGQSGWWALLLLIGPLNLIIVIYLCIKEGDKMTNTHGPIPDLSMTFWQALRGSK
jgi:uncharacterized membrane protein YhaH (DUF805 family)